MKSFSPLLIDISNTFTKYTVDLKKIYRLPTSQWNRKTCKTLAQKLKTSHAMISSVVPKINHHFASAFPHTHFLSHKSPLDIAIDYPQPQHIGADRLANTVAVAAQKLAPAIVIDFGTAVTFDVIDARNTYLGGVIAPGIQALTNYLHEKTALLPTIQLSPPSRAIGQSTKEAMQIGAMIGYPGLIQAILQAIRKEMKTRKKIHMIATGGDAKLLAQKLKRQHLLTHIDPQLTLKGLAIVAQKIWG
ncbi:MAG: type III pantothenate kinase [Verrucomicrobiae bacterium]|nr:type III pantothenate kinase [Verrucomicrobiae bacterium]